VFALGDGCFCWSNFRAVADLGNRSKKDADQKFSTFLFVVGEQKKVTPRNMNMEPKNHPIEKENHLNQTIMTSGSSR